MPASLSTARLSASDRAERWHEAVSHAFVPMAVDLLEEVPSPGTIVGHQLGPIRILRVQAGPQVATRTRRMIADDGPPSLILSLQERGTALKEQDGRESVIRPGEFSITDTSRVFRKKIEEKFVFTSFHFPRAELDVPERDLRALTATPFSGAEGSAALVAAYLSRMAREAQVLDEVVGRRAASTALDLLALLVDDRSGRSRQQAPRNAASLERVKDHILRNLRDPDLCPSTIAEANFMSVRFLHKLFHLENTTVSSWIRAQRLERCSRDLLRPVAAELGIAGIARRWGFANSSHFSRAFRAAYGMPPRDWQISSNQAR
ncbi:MULTISPECIES: AraC-like ligand-binding domain-containing protein [Kitasatospora]|uniref:Helix-turn-helix domain-containing protein n=1 Tax=Kitasatospora cathayae TaxID=3004092 RepID=A0ABY7Q0U8_9ACTN|nr:helix-turn-helix domain-containing protein [Kitasatospora sp. HUAS 3-15]WBP86246.1 helix-turn-helix domain-containing protein [Kitasatospora sp. HUAS 3-15]